MVPAKFPDRNAATFLVLLGKCKNISSKLVNTVHNGYSDILDIVILLSLGMNPRLHETHT